MMTFDNPSPLVPPQAARMARCTCGKTVPSHPRLAFFEARGEGSRDATEFCECGYHKCAHERQPRDIDPRSDPRSVIECGICTGFTPRGANEYDAYYCGHGGWD